MTYHDDVLSSLGQLTFRESARMAGTLAPTLDITLTWFKCLCSVTADFWEANRCVALPLSPEHADEIFSKVNETTEIMTPHQLWTIFADLGAYGDDSITSHFANSHTIDNVARYTLNGIGTRLIPELLAYLHGRVIQPRNTFD